MNRTEKILISGLNGTTFMTIFSYVLSETSGEDFSEPEHLSTMLHRFLPGSPKTVSRIMGWRAHYTVGMVFALAYVELWETGKIKPDLKNALVMGLVSGALAVGIWKFTIKIHPLPPWINYNKYYLQLVPAHIVFAVFAMLAYRALLKNKEDNTIVS